MIPLIDPWLNVNNIARFATHALSLADPCFKHKVNRLIHLNWITSFSSATTCNRKELCLDYVTSSSSFLKIAKMLAVQSSHIIVLFCVFPVFSHTVIESQSLQLSNSRVEGCRSNGTAFPILPVFTRPMSTYESTICKRIDVTSGLRSAATAEPAGESNVKLVQKPTD